jgi:hypothetical protein
MTKIGPVIREFVIKRRIFCSVLSLADALSEAFSAIGMPSLGDPTTAP